MTTGRWLGSVAVSVLALALSGCGGDGGGVQSTPAPPVAAPPPAPAPAPTPAPVPAPTPVPPAVNFNTAEYQRSNYAVQANALAAYQAGATGRGVTVGVIDSGIDLTSGEFPNISPASRDIAGNRGIQQSDLTNGLHGTVVSQVLLGAKNDLRTQGVAFDATLLVLRTDSPGSCGTTSGSDSGCSHDDNNIAAGLDLARSSGARVVNISLGGSPPNSTLRSAIDRATAAGVIIVISAGNDGQTNPAIAVNPDPLAQIAIDPVARGLVLVAGATTSNQTLAPYSNKAGNSAQYYVTALGDRVRFIDNSGTSYLYSGTSFSAPVVAGAVALLAQAFPNLTSAQLVDLLLRTATPLGSSSNDPVYGRGEVNLARAFQPQGQTSLSATREAVSLSLAANATLSSVMGDAGTAPLNAQIKDMYGRNYTVDLAGTLARQPRGGRLTAALRPLAQSWLGGGGATTIGFAVQPGRAADHLTLTSDQSQAARALAGAVAMRLDARTQVALGYARSAGGLIADRISSTRPAFLLADDADGGQALAKAPQAGASLRRQVGTVGVTLSAENGQLQLWHWGDTGPLSDGLRRYRYDQLGVALDWARGPLALRTAFSQLREYDTLLGGRFTSAFGGNGATSWFADTQATLTPLANWRLGASWRQGWTAVPARLGRDASTLRTGAWAVDLTRFGLFGRDSLSLRWAQPLRVTGGGLALPGLGDSNWLSLTPQGRERDVEAAYARPLGGGWLAVNAFWRQQPGNYLLAPDDTGVALRWSRGF